MISGQQALAQLREGNRRFVASVRDPAAPLSQPRPLRLPHAQEPFAIVLGCSDARVPAELVFGQGFGDLFVIRVAGNIVAPSQVGSVEFAAARFGTRLAVVLGHTQCGAIAATLEELRQPASHQSPNLRSIVDRIRPAVEPLLATAVGLRPEALLAHAVRANVRAAAKIAGKPFKPSRNVPSADSVSFASEVLRCSSVSRSAANAANCQEA